MTKFGVLDKDLKLIGFIEPINVQWTRRYYNFSEFVLQFALDNYIKSMCYIYRTDTNQLMIINKDNYENKDGSILCEISGYSIEYLLNDSIIHPRYIAELPIEKMIFDIFQKYKGDIRFIELGVESNLGTTLQMQESNTEMGSKFFEMLQAQELSYRCKYDPTTSKILLEVWQGKDRTETQSKNNYVTFSKSYRNLHNVNVSVDNSNFKNYAIVVGNGAYEDGKQITVFVDKSNGEFKKKLYVDATDMTFEEPEDDKKYAQTLSDFKKSLRQKGLEKLDEHNIVEDISFDATDEIFKYGVDYDLGDKCTVIIEDIGKAFSARIVEIYEVLKDNSREITLTFGERTPTLFQRVKKALS